MAYKIASTKRNIEWLRGTASVLILRHFSNTFETFEYLAEKLEVFSTRWPEGDRISISTFAVMSCYEILFDIIVFLSVFLQIIFWSCWKPGSCWANTPSKIWWMLWFVFQNLFEWTSLQNLKSGHIIIRTSTGPANYLTDASAAASFWNILLTERIIHGR